MLICTHEYTSQTHRRAHTPTDNYTDTSRYQHPFKLMQSFDNIYCGCSSPIVRVIILRWTTALKWRPAKEDEDGSSALWPET